MRNNCSNVLSIYALMNYNKELQGASILWIASHLALTADLYKDRSLGQNILAFYW